MTSFLSFCKFELDQRQKKAFKAVGKTGKKFFKVKITVKITIKPFGQINHKMKSSHSEVEDGGRT